MIHMTLIDAASLAKLIGRPGIAVVDCRFDLMPPQVPAGETTSMGISPARATRI
jgi:peptidyl-tRNA hydrolase